MLISKIISFIQPDLLPYRCIIDMTYIMQSAKGSQAEYTGVALLNYKLWTGKARTVVTKVLVGIATFLWCSRAMRRCNAHGWQFDVAHEKNGAGIPVRQH
jgi:hypothetical protein